MKSNSIATPGTSAFREMMGPLTPGLIDIDAARLGTIAPGNATLGAVALGITGLVARARTGSDLPLPARGCSFCRFVLALTGFIMASDSVQRSARACRGAGATCVALFPLGADVRSWRIRRASDLGERNRPRTVISRARTKMTRAAGMNVNYLIARKLDLFGFLANHAPKVRAVWPRWIADPLENAVVNYTIEFHRIAI